MSRSAAGGKRGSHAATIAAETVSPCPPRRGRLKVAAQRIASRLASSAERSPLGFALLVVAVLQTAVIVAFRPCYETNDDVFMTMIASGRGICTTPDPHLIFTNLIVGRVLNFLYNLAPDVPWYGCYLFALHYAAQTALFYAALVIGRRPAVRQQSASNRSRSPVAPLGEALVGHRCAMYAIYFALAEIPMLNGLQFTTTAFTAVVAGVFLLCVAFDRRTTDADSDTAPSSIALPLTAGVILLCTGGLVRLESFAMALCVAAPIVGVLFMSRLWKMPRAQVRRILSSAAVPCAVAGLFALAVVAGATAYDLRAYASDPQWSGFREYNQLRGKFHDEAWTFYTPETAEVFARAGWSENDHALIAGWFSDEPALYAEEKLRTILDGYPWKAAHHTAQFWRPFLRELRHNRAILALALALPFVVIVAGHAAGRSGRRAVALSIGVSILLVAAVGLAKKPPPPRVYFPLLSFPTAVALLAPAFGRGTNLAPSAAVASVNKNNATTSLRPFLHMRQVSPLRVALVGMLVVGLGMGMVRQAQRSAKVARGRSELGSFLAALPANGRDVIVCWGTAMPFELLAPWDNLRAFDGRPLLTLVWTQRTPWLEATKRRFGITRLSEALFTRDDVLTVIWPADRPLYQRFAAEHFAADVDYVTAVTTGGRLEAGHFHSRPQARAAAEQRTAHPTR